jgi:hypothetical protein
MIRYLYIVKVMDGFPETLITLFAAVLGWQSGGDWLTLIVMCLAGFFWVIRIRREIQQQYFNDVWRAIKSLFRKKNKYGHDE